MIDPREIQREERAVETLIYGVLEQFPILVHTISVTTHFSPEHRVGRVTGELRDNVVEREVIDALDKAFSPFSASTTKVTISEGMIEINCRTY